MLLNKSWHFSLGLILLTVIYRNVKSNELTEVDGARRNIFMDMQHFFDRIFPPKTTTTIAPETTANINENTSRANRKLLPSMYMQRSVPKAYMKNTNLGLQSGLIEDIEKEPAYVDQENQAKISDDSEGDNYLGNKKIQKINDLKTLIIIVSGNKKMHEEMIAREGLAYYLSLSKPFIRDDLNQTTLRQAYGVACIKVAVRKCYKALRRVSDIVCGTIFRCKSSFKSTFLLKAKRGCITSFDYTRLSSEKPQTQTNKDIIYNYEKRENFIDACIPYMSPEHVKTVRKDKYLGNNLTHFVTQILRDQSDKKCQKFSREACVRACNYARDEVCSVNICGSKKKAFTKECKHECRNSYAIKASSESDSSD